MGRWRWNQRAYQCKMGSIFLLKAMFHGASKTWAFSNVMKSDIIKETYGDMIMTGVNMKSTEMNKCFFWCLNYIIVQKKTLKRKERKLSFHYNSSVVFSRSFRRSFSRLRMPSDHHHDASFWCNMHIAERWNASLQLYHEVKCCPSALHYNIAIPSGGTYCPVMCPGKKEINIFNIH